MELGEVHAGLGQQAANIVRPLPDEAQRDAAINPARASTF